MVADILRMLLREPDLGQTGGHHVLCVGKIRLVHCLAAGRVDGEQDQVETGMTAVPGTGADVQSEAGVGRGSPWRVDLEGSERMVNAFTLRGVVMGGRTGWRVVGRCSGRKRRGRRYWRRTAWDPRLCFNGHHVSISTRCMLIRMLITNATRPHSTRCYPLRDRDVTSNMPPCPKLVRCSSSAREAV